MQDAEYLELADWRRRVAEIYAAWRRAAASDPQAAGALKRDEHQESPEEGEAETDEDDVDHRDA